MGSTPVNTPPASPPPPSPPPASPQLAPPRLAPPRWTGRDSLALLLALVALYGLLGRGTFYSSDEGGVFNTGLALLTRGALDIAPGENVHRGPDGRFYACREILPSLMTMPFAFTGMVLQAVAPAAPIAPRAALLERVGANWTSFVTVTLLGPLLIAGTLLLLHAFARAEGVAPADAFNLTLAAGLGTPLVFYARTIFPQVFEALWLMAALLLAARWRRTGSPRGAFAAGLVCGLGVMTRGAFVIPAAVFGLYLMFARPQTWAERFRTALAFAAPIALGGAVTAWVNWRRWGSPFDFGYHNPYETFSTPAWVGLYGMLASPGKGLFLYAPMMLLVVLFAPRIWRAGRAEVLVLLAITAAYLGLYCRWYDWPGGLAWGPRFLVPLIAPWVALLGRAFRSDAVAGTPGPRWPRRLLAVTAVLGFVLQLPGLALHPKLMVWSGGQLFSPRNAFLLTLTRTLFQDGPDDLWLWAPATPGFPTVPVVAAVLMLVLVLAVASLVRRWRTPAIRYPLLAVLLFAVLLVAARTVFAA